MAYFSYTYTLTNGTTADASQVQQNFTDALNGISDGTKDVNINALTCAGVATFNGNVAVGNASSDDLTVTASLASSIPLKTTYSYDLGTSTVGLKNIYLGSDDSAARTVKLSAGTVGTSYTLTVPTSGGTTGMYPVTNGSGVLTFQYTDKIVSSKTSNYTATGAEVVIPCDASGGAFTVTLPAAANNSGKHYTIIKTDSSVNAITIDGNASETINGSTTTTINTQYESIEICCDGSNWLIKNRKADSAWTAYTPTFTGFGTESAVLFYYRRVGDSIEVNGTFTTGTCTAVPGKISIPSGLTIDSAKISTAKPLLGTCVTVSASTPQVLVVANGSDYGTVWFAENTSTNNQLTVITANASFSNSAASAILFKAPITGWKA